MEFHGGLCFVSPYRPGHSLVRVAWDLPEQFVLQASELLEPEQAVLQASELLEAEQVVLQA